MGRFEIEFAQFTKVVVDAETEEEAKDLAAIMDGEEIAEHDTHEYNIWNIREFFKIFDEVEDEQRNTF